MCRTKINKPLCLTSRRKHLPSGAVLSASPRQPLPRARPSGCISVLVPVPSLLRWPHCAGTHGDRAGRRAGGGQQRRGLPSPTSLGSRSAPHPPRAGCLRSGDTGRGPETAAAPVGPVTEGAVTPLGRRTPCTGTRKPPLTAALGVPGAGGRARHPGAALGGHRRGPRTAEGSREAGHAGGRERLCVVLLPALR